MQIEKLLDISWKPTVRGKKFSTDSRNQSSDNAKTTFCRIITNIKTSVIRYSFILHWVRSVFSLLCPFKGIHCNFLRQIRDEVCFLYFYIHTIAKFTLENWEINSYLIFYLYILERRFIILHMISRDIYYHFMSN